MTTQNIGGFLQNVPVFNQSVPCEQPKAITFDVNFNGIDEFVVSMLNAIEKRVIESVQSFYFDNSFQDQIVILEMQETGQRIIIPGRTQGYINALVNREGNFTLTSSGSSRFMLIALNVPMFPDRWSATNP